MLNHAGTYHARPLGAALGFTKDNKEQAVVEFEITEEGDGQGERVTWYGYFTDKTTQSTIKALRTCGWVGDDLSDLSSIGTDDTEVKLVVNEDEWEGKKTLKVRWVNSLTGGGLALKAPMSPDQARSFAERMKGHVIKSGPATAKTPPKNRDQHASAPPVDDDVPF